MSVRCLLYGVFIVMVVAGDTLETDNVDKHLVRRSRSTISTIVDGLKNIHDNFHKKEVTLEKEETTKSDDTVNDEKESVTLDDEAVGVDSSCSVEYVVVESVHYSEVVTTECRSHNVTTCDTQPYEECYHHLREECHQVDREKCQDRVEEECHTQYRTEHSQEVVRKCDRKCQYRWEGTGGDKRWVVDPSTCICEDITRDTVAKVPFLNCSLVSRRECNDVPVRECEEVKERICEEKEREECKEEPHKECKDIHRKVPNTITYYRMFFMHLL